jgi:hypothetical protein
VVSGQSLHQVAPQAPVIGKAVQQEHRRALPTFHGVKPNVSAGDPTVMEIARQEVARH